MSGRLSIVDENNPAIAGIVWYNLTISVRDAGVAGPVGWAYTGVNVTTTFGTFPPVITSYNLSVPELSPSGTPIGIVTATSVNFNTTLTYSLIPIGFYAVFPFTITTIPSSGGGRATTGAITVSQGASVGTFSAGPRLYLATLSVQVFADTHLSYVPRLFHGSCFL